MNPVSEMMMDVSNAVFAQWHKTETLFKHPITCT